jgi:hypothetical protein
LTALIKKELVSFFLFYYEASFGKKKKNQASIPFFFFCRTSLNGNKKKRVWLLFLYNQTSFGNEGSLDVAKKKLRWGKKNKAKL